VLNHCPASCSTMAQPDRSNVDSAVPAFPEIAQLGIWPSICGRHSCQVVEETI
jgi:hypothetical protein